MLKKTVTYKDFNDQQVTEDLYFNLSADEWMEMEVDHEEGFGEFLKKIIADGNNKIIFAEFKKFILAAYGQKSADGRRFTKSPELSHEFSQTAAYQELFLEIATDGDKMGDFFNGLMTKEMADRFSMAKLPTVAGIALPSDPRDPAFQALQATANESRLPPPAPHS